MQQFECSFKQNQECTGYDLFRYCHVLARRCKHRFPGQPLLPSGARIFYYTRRLLLAHGVCPEVSPDEVHLAQLVMERFLQAAPQVAGWLVREFPRAVQVRALPSPRLRRSLFRESVPRMPERTGIPVYLDGNTEGIPQIWERLWEICWREQKQEHLARLMVLVYPDRLRVAPVASPGDPPHVALRLLRAQLAQDAERGWHVPTAGAYLYDEPLEIWLLRSFITDQWFSLLLQALAKHPEAYGASGSAGQT